MHIYTNAQKHACVWDVAVACFPKKSRIETKYLCKTHINDTSIQIRTNERTAGGTLNRIAHIEVSERTEISTHILHAHDPTERDNSNTGRKHSNHYPNGSPTTRKATSASAASLSIWSARSSTISRSATVISLPYIFSCNETGSKGR